MILGQEEKPSLRAVADGAGLEHYGKKGMKWGHHKPKVTTSDIKTARKEVQGLTDTVNAKAYQLNSVMDPNNHASSRTQTKAVKEYESAVKAINTSDAHVNANRFTKGEKAALLVLGGPVGAVVIGAAAVDRKRIAKNVANAKAQK